MYRKFLKAKIHRVTLTEANLNYEGSLTLDPLLIEAAGIAPFEAVQVYNLANGARFETYVIEGERGSGKVCLNGAAARMGIPGDLLIIATYAYYTPQELAEASVNLVFVDNYNRVVSVKKEPILTKTSLI